MVRGDKQSGDDVLPHFESSESENSSNASDEDSSSAFDSPASEQDNSVSLSNTSPQTTCAVSPDGIKSWTLNVMINISLALICIFLQ